MRIKYNATSPGRVELILKPGDEFEVNQQLGERLKSASAALQEPKATATKSRSRRREGKA